MQNAHCFQHLYCCTHHCINHFADDIRRQFSCAANFLNDKGHKSLQRLNQSQIFRLVTAGMKETSNHPLVGMQTLPEGEKHIADHDHGRMTNQAVIVPQLGFLSQLQMLLEHLEAHLDIPSLAVDPDDFLYSQLALGGKYGQPVPLVAVAHKHDFYPLPLLGLHQDSGQNLCQARTFSQLAVQPPKRVPLPLMLVLISA